MDAGTEQSATHTFFLSVASWPAPHQRSHHRQSRADSRATAPRDGLFTRDEQPLSDSCPRCLPDRRSRRVHLRPLLGAAFSWAITTVPCPALPRTSPRRATSLKARLTVFRWKPRSSAIERCDGSRSPGRNTPLLIASSICWAMARYGVPRRRAKSGRHCLFPTLSMREPHHTKGLAFHSPSRRWERRQERLCRIP